MRRILFVTIALVVLLMPTTTAFAGEGVNLGPDQPNPAQLGEVWLFWAPVGFFLPFERVDTFLYRPPTCVWNAVWDDCAWPLTPAYPYAGGPFWGTWFWTGPDSEYRRQSWPAFQWANEWGQYFSIFMLPRDEVWYPCSYPYKWKCNYVLYPGDPINPPIFEWHSPAWQGNFEFGLVWPWYDWVVWELTDDFNAAWLAANPQDTVSPLVVWVQGISGAAGFIELEVDGYFWKWSDLEDGFEFVTLIP